MSRFHVAVLLLLAPATFADDTAAADAACYGNANSVVQSTPGGAVSGDCCYVATMLFNMEDHAGSDTATNSAGPYFLRDNSYGNSPGFSWDPTIQTASERGIPAGWRKASCTSEDWAIILGCGLEDRGWTTSDYTEDSSVPGTICCIGGDCCEQPGAIGASTRVCSDTANTVGCVEPVSEGGACVGDSTRAYFIGHKVPEGTAQPAQELSNIGDYDRHSFTTFDQGVCPCVTHPFRLLLSLLPRAPRIESDVVRASPAQGNVVPPARLHSRGRGSTLYDAGADGIVADRRGFCRADR